MSDISAEITAFLEARYGEDVRSAIVSLANKLNNDLESTETTINTALGTKANTSDVETALSYKQNTLTWDYDPEFGSQNPVTSSGIYQALQSGLSGKQNILTFDGSPQNGSMNPVTSNGVYQAIASVEASGVIVDDALYNNSTNPVQSKVIQSKFQSIFDVSSTRGDWDLSPQKNSYNPVVSEGIYNELYYKHNDTFSLLQVPINGHLTDSGKTIFLCVQTPKSLADITSITIDSFKGGLRTADETDHYVENSSDNTDWTDAAAGLSLTAMKKGDHFIQIKMQKATAFTGVVNNNLVGLFCNPVTLHFYTH